MAKDYVKGVAGAFAGAFVGSILWVILYFVGFYAGVAAFAIGLAAAFGYDKLGGPKKMRLPIIIAAMIVVAFVAQFLCFAIEVASINNDAGTNFTLAQLMRDEPDVKKYVTTNLLIAALFVLIGIAWIVSDEKRKEKLRAQQEAALENLQSENIENAASEKTDVFEGYDAPGQKSDEPISIVAEEPQTDNIDKSDKI